MSLVAGIDSSTQSCKVTIRDGDTGMQVRAGSAPHPRSTEVDPEQWWQALTTAISRAGGLEDVDAVAVAAQQHGLICLDENGSVIRDALLWNDTRSAAAAASLVSERDPRWWATRVGSVPLAAFTVSKLRWLAESEPQNADRVAAVCLPHDWLTWRLSGRSDLSHLATDRGDASGTGYWSPASGEYDTDALLLAFGRQPHLPTVLPPCASPGLTPDGLVLGAGTGDNAAAALGLNAHPGDVIISLGTSGVVSAIYQAAIADPTGIVAGFADAAGEYLPLACTLNAARVLDTTAALLDANLEQFAQLAISAPADADRPILIPYFDGERTPNLPNARGSLQCLSHANTTRASLARAAVEGVLCGLADGLDALTALGVTPRRILLIGGGAKSAAVRHLIPAIFGLPIFVPAPDEYVAAGAARQAAWSLSAANKPPQWSALASPQPLEQHQIDSEIRERYRRVRDTITIR